MGFGSNKCLLFVKYQKQTLTKKTSSFFGYFVQKIYIYDLQGILPQKTHLVTYKIQSKAQT